MLKSLSIRNVVLIDKLDLDFQNGFSVLSGETGAGKSILLDSVGLLLGKRAEIGMIRSGCDKLSVCGSFEIADKKGELAALCAEYDLDFEHEIIIKRTLNQDGKGKIFFNDQPITQKLLKEIGGYLVEIHGQFDNQGLLNPATHLSVLDNYGAYPEKIAAMKAAFAVYKKAKDDRVNAEAKIAQAKADEENLRHWVDEFQKMQPRENEPEELEEKRRQMMNAEKILENLDTAYKAMVQGGVQSSLRQAQAAISRVNALLNGKFDNIYALLDTALVNADEASEEIETASNEVSLNQNELDAVEERLFALKALARKHNTTVEELPQVWAQMEDSLQNLTRGEENIEILCKLEEAAYKDYVKKATEVSQARLAAALRLDGKIQAELPDLKMEKARFMTQISTKPENLWNENGRDEVCFMVSTNPNTPYGSISKIASGGELARFMLALKVNLAQSSQVETMIFDEVDTGIGGATAQAVGEKLAKLGEQVQVLVVTHSPQVAAQSKYHYKVEKTTVDNVTTTSLRELSAAEKTEEVARMLSGEHITDEARAAAKVLIGA
ncbi:MAG: DNA repair protein RecN [Alphaproteobacteria bacterium]|nr:DNA repair protein RecN [Alphaproteobacteria bacterium]MDY4690145.1 DNA repair protein RecN [Alphaproteobacteria bacterium]